MFYVVKSDQAIAGCYGEQYYAELMAGTENTVVEIAGDSAVENWPTKKIVNGAFVNDDNLSEENNRIVRGNLLQKTDWWAVADRTMTAEQTTYRQALRDITTHANWPNLADSDWPTKPE